MSRDVAPVLSRDLNRFLGVPLKDRFWHSPPVPATHAISGTAASPRNVGRVSPCRPNAIPGFQSGSTRQPEEVCGLCVARGNFLQSVVVPTSWGEPPGAFSPLPIAQSLRVGFSSERSSAAIALRLLLSQANISLHLDRDEATRTINENGRQ